MLRRFVPASAAAALLIAGLTGCSAQQAAQVDCDPAFAPGSLSDGVTVLGDFGQLPEVKIPEDATISKTQRTVISESEDRSAIAVDQSLVSVNMAFFDSATGKQLYASPALQSEGQAPEFLLLSKEQENPLSAATECAAAGDRVVLAMDPEQSAQLVAQLGGKAGSSLVGVIDVVDARPLAAQGPARGLPNGYPAVVTNEDGQPGVVLPPSDAPAGTSSAVRIQGDGEKVTAEDNVIAQVLTVGWDQQVRQNTWESGLIALGTEAQIEQSGFAFRTELTGHKIGSQVIVVENVADASPQVSVVDILGTN